MSGPSAGVECVFPFKLENITHNACTVDGNSDSEENHWCSTKLDEDGVHIGGQGNYGYCGPECPVEENCSANNGKKCVFPFKWKNLTHNECTVHGSPEPDKRWCSTKVDEDGVHIAGQGNYGYCGPECPVEEGCWATNATWGNC